MQLTLEIVRLVIEKGTLRWFRLVRRKDDSGCIKRCRGTVDRSRQTRYLRNSTWGDWDGVIIQRGCEVLLCSERMHRRWTNGERKSRKQLTNLGLPGMAITMILCGRCVCVCNCETGKMHSLGNYPSFTACTLWAIKIAAVYFDRNIYWNQITSRFDIER